MLLVDSAWRVEASVRARAHTLFVGFIHSFIRWFINRFGSSLKGLAGWSVNTFEYLVWLVENAHFSRSWTLLIEYIIINVKAIYV